MSGPLRRDGATADCGDSVVLQDITPGIGVGGSLTVLGLGALLADPRTQDRLTVVSAGGRA